MRLSAISSDFVLLDEAEPDDRGVDRVLDYLRGLVAQVLPERPDLIVLPEVCDRPDNFSLERRLAWYGARGERILDFFRETARKNGCHVVYATERRDESGAWRNAAWLIDRTGAITGAYDKMFVTLPQMEEDGFPCATEPALFTGDFGTAGMAICFDLNFQPILEAYRTERPDLIIFPSHYHGSFVAEYWAWACRSYFLAAIARRECYLVSPAGHVMARSTTGRRFMTATINLDRAVVHVEWDEVGRLDALKRAYGQGVSITDAGFGGNFLVTNETEQGRADTMVREHGLTLLDDFLSGSARVRAETAGRRA
jgi:hypothetical protein